MTAILPLAGITVLDFTSNVSGPFTTQVLAELGADVIKVERPGAGDDGRRLNPSRDGYSSVFEAINRGKRSIAIDLKQPAGRELALDLAGRADVVAENMRTGTMAALGLGFDAVAAANPRTVYLSISGFGQSGPLADRPGYDMVMQARAGIIDLTGEPDRTPVRVGLSVVDFGSGGWATLGVVCALMQRDHAGPQHLDFSLFDVALAWATLPLAQYNLAGVVPRRMGGQTAMGAPADIYPTADGYLVVAVVNEPIWARFCEATGLTELQAHPSFATNADRDRNRDELSQILVTHFAQGAAREWAERLQAAGVTAEAVAQTTDLLSDEQALARDAFIRVDHPHFGDAIAAVALPLGNRKWQATRRMPAPALGQHTTEVMRQFEIEETRITELRRAGIVS